MDAIAFAAQQQPVQVRADPPPSFPGKPTAFIGVPRLQLVEHHARLNAVVVHRMATDIGERCRSIGVGQWRNRLARLVGQHGHLVTHGRVIHRRCAGSCGIGISE
jgi:hypothetical protein